MYIKFGNGSPKLVITEYERRMLADPDKVDIVIERIKKLTKNGAPVDTSVLKRTNDNANLSTS